MRINNGFNKLYEISNFSKLIDTCESLKHKFGEWSYREDRHMIAEDCTSVPFYWLDNGVKPCKECVHKFTGIPDEIGRVISELESYFDGFVCKAMLVNLRAGGSIPMHTDHGIDFELTHRCHIPIYCNDRCRFFAGGKWYNLSEGFVYEINNLDAHGVVNLGKDRWHLVIDISLKEIDNE